MDARRWYANPFKNVAAQFPTLLNRDLKFAKFVAVFPDGRRDDHYIRGPTRRVDFGTLDLSKRSTASEDYDSGGRSQGVLSYQDASDSSQ
jgi:hypothetical protein